MYKEIDVVLLATNKKSNLLIVYSDVEKTNSKLTLNGFKNDNYKEYQHLYFLSDDEIKEGDWCVVGEHISQYNKNTTSLEELKGQWKKIIATTDKSLGLPQPSESFIKYYVEEYNKRNIITKVLVEYADYLDERNGFVKKPNVLPNNTINIKPIKEKFYTQKEVDELLDRNTCQVTAQVLEKYKGFKSKEEVIAFGNFIRDNYHGVGAPKLISYNTNKYPHGTIEDIFVIWSNELEKINQTEQNL